MNNLLDVTNAADSRAIAQTNFQRVDGSLAFMLMPSLDLTGNPTAIIGPPAVGTFVKGQWWVDVNLAVFRCTATGTPGAWIQQFAAVVNQAPVGIVPLNYLIKIPGQNWGEFHWDGNQWLPVSPRKLGADSTNITADSTTTTADISL